MKISNKIRRISLVFSFLFLAIFKFGLNAPQQAQAQTKNGKDYDTLENEYIDAVKKDHPKTAVEICDRIIAKAEKEDNFGRLIWGYLLRFDQITQISEDSVYTSFDKLEKLCLKEKNCVRKSVLHSLLANGYSHFGRFGNATAVEVVDSSKLSPLFMSEWSDKQYKDVVLNHLRASMANMKKLSSTRNTGYEPLIQKGWKKSANNSIDASSYFNHDVLHVIYFLNLQTIKEISFASREERKVLGEDLKKSVKDFYEKQGNTQAALYLEFCNIQDENLSYRERCSAYENLLKLSVEGSKLSQAVLYNMAECCYNFDKVKALDLCNKYIAQYPDGYDIQGAKNLKDKIINPAASVDIQKLVTFGDSMGVAVKYANIQGITLQRAKVKNENDVKILKERAYLSFKDIKALDSYKNGDWESIHLDLAPTPDYKEKTFKTRIESPAECGVYIYRIILDNNRIKPESAVIQYVTSIATIVERSLKSQDQKVEVVVVDRRSGNPLQGADVVVYKYVRKESVVLKSAKTDSQGRVSLSDLGEGISIDVDASLSNDNGNPYISFFNNNSFKDKNDNVAKADIFIDRGLYRPGQTVYFKGIAYTQVNDKTEAAQDVEFKVVLMDANYKVISEQVLRTNEFGSFNGSFALPLNSLNGLYTIDCASSSKSFACNNFSARFQVAEYKRPTFEVKFDPYELPYKLGDTVTLTGKVRTLTDLPVDEADVKVTIKHRCFSRFREEPKQEKFVKTDAEGCFSVDIPLAGDRGYWYVFSIEAEVTSQSGETQSGVTSLSAGRQSYILSVANKEICKDQQITNKFNIRNEAGEDIKGVVCYSLENSAGEVVDSGEVEANLETVFKWDGFPSGRYKLKAFVKDLDTTKCTLNENLVIFSFKDSKPIENTPLWFKMKDNTLYYGTSYTDATVFLIISSIQKTEAFECISISNQIKTFDLNYKPEYGDGVCVKAFIYRDGQLYEDEIDIKLPQPDKKLDLKWSVFRDKLMTGQKEKWSLTILDKNGKPANAEMVALMYDSALDKIAENQSPLNSFLLIFRRNIPSIYLDIDGINKDNTFRSTNIDYRKPSKTIVKYRTEFLSDYFSKLIENKYRSYLAYAVPGRVAGLNTEPAVLYSESSVRVKGVERAYNAETNYAVADSSAETEDDEPNVNPRTNFAETAFFYPELRTDKDGNVNIEFTLPESLTRWKFMALAHTDAMDYGALEEEIIARKEFMVAPNMPRFFRRGDRTNIASTVYNLNSEPVNANVKMELFDPVSEKIYSSASKKISVGANGNAVVNFEVAKYPEGIDILGVRIVAFNNLFSDGEQHLLSVLPNTVRVVESIPLTIRGNQTKTFSLEKLFNHHSQSAENKALTVEYTGNPAWYAVLALPTLSQPQSDNTVSWAASLYVNSISSTILRKNPKILSALETWKLSAAAGKKNVLQSKLLQNEELKNVVLNETPWVMEAKDQNEQMERLFNLLNPNNIQVQSSNAVEKLSKLQLGDGGWPWFKGMQSSRHITDYVLTLLARMKLYAGGAVNLSDEETIENMQKDGLFYLGSKAKEEYERIQEYLKKNPKAKDEGISYPALRYLYILAITYPYESYDQMISDGRIDSKYATAFKYFLKKVNETPRRWDMEDKSMVAVVLSRAGREKEAKDVTQSVREHLTKSETQGMFFDFEENPWGWNRLKINAQTAAIEAVALVDKDSETIEEMKLWLLNQKRTQDWGSTTTTADAIYSLLMVGANSLDNEGEVEIDLIAEKNREKGVSADKVPLLNYVKEQFTDQQSVDRKSITVTKKDDGMAWGAVYATFNEKNANMEEVSSDELSVSKELYVKRSVPFGNGYKDELERITKDNPVKVGDVVTARMVIKVGREMEFVHLKDQRAACFEPMGQLSGYRYGGGTWYYLEIKDAATNLFFEHLSKGVYILELNYRVSRTGEYDAGFATLQSTYAPDFSAHSAATRIIVKDTH